MREYFLKEYYMLGSKIVGINSCVSNHKNYLQGMLLTAAELGKCHNGGRKQRIFLPYLAEFRKIFPREDSILTIWEFLRRKNSQGSMVKGTEM